MIIDRSQHATFDKIKCTRSATDGQATMRSCHARVIEEINTPLLRSALSEGHRYGMAIGTDAGDTIVSIALPNFTAG